MRIWLLPWAVLWALCAVPAAAQPAAGVPVTTAIVARQDVPVLLRGLGTVQALNAVQIRARVDGMLMQVPVKEGQEVKKGDLVAVIDPRPYQAILDQAMAKRQQDQAQLANAKRELVRTTSLARQDFASRQQLDNQQAQVEQTTAAVAGDQAAIEAAQLNLSYCYITAPIDGRVGLRQIDPGNLIRAADAAAILTISQLHPVSVLFTLPQADLPRIVTAMAVRKLPVTAFAADGTTDLGHGTLLTIDNTIDPSTGTIRLKAEFPNPENRLWPGQFVHAAMLVDTDRGVLTVPSIAVQHGPGGLFVYQVKPDSTVAVQPVSISRDTGSVALIAAGLTAGEEVVTEGQSRLRAGARVAREAPQAAPAGRSS